MVGAGVAALPFLWILWVNWTGSIHFFAREPNADFFDAQAKAIMHGTLAIRPDILGIEGFHHGANYYTYFGLFPSLLRVPILLVAPGLYGQLTPASIIVAWMVTALFSSLLLWRVRVAIRGDAPLGRLEATSYGALVAMICAGSVILLLAATPWVYDEDIAWSIALTIGALFALLGVLERPSTRRVVLAGVLILAANLDRVPTGMACALAALLVAAWLAVGRGGAEGRRWAIPMAAVAVVPVAASCVVNWIKFGTPLGLPFSEQVWTTVNAHRRLFLARNGNRPWGFEFVPTTMWTYFQPFGIRLQGVFPFVTLPATPPDVFAHATFDQTYRTASIPASMPLLFLLTCAGLVASLRGRFRRRSPGLWILLLAAAGAFGVSAVWGYIAPRFEGDIVPLMALGAAVGTCHLWRVLENRRAVLRKILVLCASLFGAFELVASFGIAAVPNLLWNGSQVTNFVSVQKRISDHTGHPLDAEVMRGASLPYYAPAGRLFIVGNCAGFYVSTGEDFTNQPVNQRQHDTWVAVEQTPNSAARLVATFQSPPQQSTRSPALLMTSGTYTLTVQVEGEHFVRFTRNGPAGPLVSDLVHIRFGSPVVLSVQLDPNLHHFSVSLSRGIVFQGEWPDPGALTIPTEPSSAATGTGATFTGALRPSAPMPLCRSLLPHH